MSKKPKQTHLRLTAPPKHDAGIFRDGTYFEPSRWSLSAEPRRRLAGYKRAGIAVACLITAACVKLHPALAAAVLLLTAAPALGAYLVVAYRWWERRDHRRMVRQLAVRTAHAHGQPVRGHRSWLDVPLDYRTRDDGVVAVFDVPDDFTAADRDMEDIKRAVEVTTSVESPDVDRKLDSRLPQLIYKRSDPPPDKVTWEDVEEAMREASPSQFVVGLGKKNKLVKASLSEDSPHFGIFMGSGAGKSNLATFWMLQALIRGWLVLVLDSKFFSYPYAFKDMDAEFDLLPNVRYCRRTPDLHNAMAWLGDEFARRTMIAERHIDANGRVHAGVGPRMLIVCEEMNLAEGRLKDHWAAERALDKDLPRKSPAFQGLGAVAFGGRAVDMHLVLIGQQGTAASLGGGAIRENVGVKCLSRYSPQSWKMQAGDMPMPPAPWTPGRVQCLAGGEISEAQTPWMDEEAGMDGERIRQLALSGTVTQCPPGMPGGGNGALAPAVVGQTAAPFTQGPEQPVVVQHDPGVIGPGRGPRDAITLAEAVAEGLWPTIEAARQARHRQGWVDVETAAGRTPKPGSAHRYQLSDIYAYKRGKR